MNVDSTMIIVMSEYAKVKQRARSWFETKVEENLIVGSDWANEVKEIMQILFVRFLQEEKATAKV